jgi:hypothetical protein
MPGDAARSFPAEAETSCRQKGRVVYRRLSAPLAWDNGLAKRTPRSLTPARSCSGFRQCSHLMAPTLHKVNSLAALSAELVLPES